MAGRQQPKTGGRKKGTPNKLTAARKAAILASGLTPLDYMLSIMRDETQPQKMRMKAAAAAAKYVHPKLKSVDLSGHAGGGGTTIRQLASVCQRDGVADEAGLNAAIATVQSFEPKISKHEPEAATAPPATSPVEANGAGHVDDARQQRKAPGRRPKAAIPPKKRQASKGEKRPQTPSDGPPAGENATTDHIAPLAAAPGAPDCPATRWKQNTAACKARAEANPAAWTRKVDMRRRH